MLKDCDKTISTNIKVLSRVGQKFAPHYLTHKFLTIDKMYHM